MKISRKSKRGSGITESGALSDLAFLLIIFFMLSTTFIVLPGIKIDLPKVSAQKIELEKTEIVLTVDDSGEMYFDQQPVDMNQMRMRLNSIASENPRTLVLLKGDRSAHYGPVIDVLNAIRIAGLNRIAIVTRKPTRSESLEIDTKQ